MKKLFLFNACVFLLLTAGYSQVVVDSTTDSGGSFIQKDFRVDILGKKIAEYNINAAKTNASNKGYANGYRLMVVNTNDRAYAMQVRSYLLQRYPEQQLHMTFVNPYIKLKFGDFIDRNDAVRTRNDLMKSNVIKNNIYIVPEQVIVKKPKVEEDVTD